MSLLPRLASGNEDNLVEFEAGSHLAGGNQVAMVDWIECATHDTETMSLMRVGAAPSGQASGPRWQGHEFLDAPAGLLAVRATFADRPGDQQQDEEETEPEDSEGPGRDW